MKYHALFVIFEKEANLKLLSAVLYGLTMQDERQSIRKVSVT